MKILLGVHQFFPDHYTGTERYVLNLAKQLQRMGHYVKVLTYSFLDPHGFREGYSSKVLFKEYFYEGVPVIALRHRELPSDRAFVFNFFDTAMYEEIKRIIKGEIFDIYHCAHPLRITSSLMAAKESGAKVLFMVTDYFMMCPRGIMLRLDNALCDGPNHGESCLKYCFPKLRKEEMQKRMGDSQKMLEYCDRLLSPSLFLIRLFNHAEFIRPERFELSRHGFDYAKKKTHFLKEQRETITFGYIGTVQYHKGVHVMVEGFRNARHKNINLQVWGGCFHEVGYEKRLRSMAKGDRRIEFKGQYNFNDIEEILKDIDVVIVPSIWYENAPLTITTSLAYGIPVITSDIGGMSEIIENGRNGFTFAVGDSADLSYRISALANDPGLLLQFRRNIRYPIRVEEEAFNTELVYRRLLTQT